MSIVQVEGFLVRQLRRAVDGPAFLATCALLAFAGTVSALFPVTAMIVPAALLAPPRWRRIALFSAIGSAVGATVLVLVFHHLGWSQVYGHFPEMLAHPTWVRVMRWAEHYGVPALFAIAVSPLPQTPALIFFGVARHDYAGVALAMFAGKLVKYGVLAWAASRFPQRFARFASRVNPP